MKQRQKKVRVKSPTHAKRLARTELFRQGIRVTQQRIEQFITANCIVENQCEYVRSVDDRVQNYRALIKYLSNKYPRQLVNNYKKLVKDKYYSRNTRFLLLPLIKPNGYQPKPIHLGKFYHIDSDSMVQFEADSMTPSKLSHIIRSNNLYVFDLSLQDDYKHYLAKIFQKRAD